MVKGRCGSVEPASSAGNTLLGVDVGVGPFRVAVPVTVVRPADAAEPGECARFGSIGDVRCTRDAMELMRPRVFPN